MNKNLGISAAVALVAALAVYLYSGSPDRNGQDSNRASQEVGERLVQVAVPTTFSEAAQIGKRAYDAVCADCHGENAAGRNGMGPPLVHKIYEPSHHADAAFLLAVRNGVRAHHWNFGNMPPQQGLTDADVKGITRYVRELQRANGIE